EEMKKLLTICCLLFSALSLYAGTGPPSSRNYGATSKDLIEQSGVKGGLVVCIGAENPEFVAGLRAGEKYLVHCLDVDQKNVDAARKYIQGKGLYGKVSVDTFDGEHLPYADNLVNLLVCEEALGIGHEALGVPGEEIERVLAPRGVLLVPSDSELQVSGLSPQPSGNWLKLSKPVPPSIDDWTHFLHGPDNNAVAQDTVINLPRSLQWINGQRWQRSHEELASVSATVSANGRLFYIVDKSPGAYLKFMPRWTLVAFDAFNGIRLWERDISVWNDHMRHFRTGPAGLGSVAI
ncbi:class I SAM-dependent methyltransferase, partial [Verrucomicrobiota bacterium]